MLFYLKMTPFMEDPFTNLNHKLLVTRLLMSATEKPIGQYLLQGM